MTLTRRALLAITASFAATVPLPGMAQTAPAIHVLKDPNCGCCTAWIDILKEDGFTVTTERSFGTLLIRHKLVIAMNFFEFYLLQPFLFML